jgi:RHS repeat-associated protein
LGSVSLTTDSNGEVIAESRYLPYGQERWSNGAAVTDFGFTSQRNERSFGLYDYNARYYSPYLNRFISPDTIVPEPTSSGGFNRYRYTRNNPLRYTDPSGHCEPEEDCIELVNEWSLGFYSHTAEEALPVAATIVDFIPYAGDAKGVIEVFTGKDIISGEDLGNWRYLGLLGLVGLAEVRRLRNVETLYHAVENADVAQSVLKGIAPEFFNEGSRFGGAFYTSQNGVTTIAELNAGGKNAEYVIRYSFDVENAKILDLTDPDIAKEWGYVHDPGLKDQHQKIGQKALESGYDAIKFESFRVAGTDNYAILQNFEELLTPETKW